MSRRVCLDVTSLLNRDRIPLHRYVHYRRILFRWLYEVCRDFRYSTYTYTIAIRLTDAYISESGLDPDEYQLVGITALFLAAKLEERTTHRMADYVMVTDGACTAEDIVHKERELLTAADCEACIHLPHAYLSYFSSEVMSCGSAELQALFPGVLAAVMERSLKHKSPRSLCLRAIQELERIFRMGAVEDDTKIYLEIDGTFKHIAEATPKLSGGAANRIDLY